MSRKVRVVRGSRGAFAFACVAALGLALAGPHRVAADQGTFTNTTSISIPGPQTVGHASPYPLQVLLGSDAPLVSLKVTIRLSHERPSDLDILLVAPTGEAVMLMSDVGGDTPVTDITLVFDNAASTPLPLTGPLVSGTYQPRNSGFLDTFPAPAPQSWGDTLSAFIGMTTGGYWSLYVVDDALGATGSILGWSLTPTYNQAFISTGPTVSIPDFGPASTYPIRVQAPSDFGFGFSNYSGYTIDALQVRLLGLTHAWPDDLDLFLSGPQGQGAIIMSDVGGGNPINLINLRLGDGAAATLSNEGQLTSGFFRPRNALGIGEGIDTFTNYGSELSVFNGTDPRGEWRLYIWDDLAGTGGGSLGQFEVIITVTYSVYPYPEDLTAAIPSPYLAIGAADPYPSTIEVAGLGGTITKITVALTFGVHTGSDDIDMLLVGPTGRNAIIWSDITPPGALPSVLVNNTYTLDDASSQAIYTLVGGLYHPTNLGAGDTFPAPAPAPEGGSALAVFNGTDPNGVWSLYIVDDRELGGGNLASWSLNITTVSTPTPTPSPTLTSTITPSPTTSRTPGPSATASPSRTPIPSPTLGASPTLTPGQLGGRGFTLQANPGGPVQASWTDGAVETGYRGLRINVATGGFDFFPSPTGALGANVTSFVDPQPLDIACYVAQILGGVPANSTQIGMSDAHCLFRGVAQGNAPSNFRIRLDQGTTATLQWDAPGGQSGYLMLVISTDGSPIVAQALAADRTQFTHNTGGEVRCYLLMAEGVASQTEALCAFPNAHQGLADGNAARALADLSSRFLELRHLRPQSAR